MEFVLNCRKILLVLTENEKFIFQGKPDTASGGTGAGGGIKVKCRDFPSGKASPFLSQALDDRRGDWGKKRRLKKSFYLCSEREKKNSETGFSIFRPYGKTSSGSIKELGLDSKGKSRLFSVHKWEFEEKNPIFHFRNRRNC